MQKTILELDLIGYSDKARELEEHLGVDLVMRFNDQIQEFVDMGLTAAGLKREDVNVQSTGDGAIVVLETAEQAHKFAEAVHKACGQHNKTKRLESAKRWFRMAAATGDIEIRGKDLAGIVIANAVRLETAGEAGHCLVDRATYENLPKRLRKHYLPEEEVRGKRDELIPARRRVFRDEASPRPDHVTLTMNLSRADFNDVAAKALIRELTRALGVPTSAITIEAIRTGSIEVVLRFNDADALARFISRHVNGEAGLQTVFAEWKIQKVAYHAGVKVIATVVSHSSGIGKSKAKREQQPIAQPPNPQSMLAHAKEQLRPLAEQLLASEVTRKFILQHNQLQSTTTAWQLAKRMLESNAPMDFLRQCIRREKPCLPEQLEELNKTVWRLAQVIAPVCLQLNDLTSLAQYLDGNTTHAELPTPDLIVAKSQVALFKNVSVNLNTQLDWELIRYDDLPKDRDQVTAFPHPPHVGIYADGSEGREDIVEVFTEGLIRFLAPHKPHRTNVRAALKELAEKDKVYICVFLPARLSQSNLGRLRETYPELILLVQGAADDTEQNAKVLDQIKRIKDEFCPQRN